MANTGLLANPIVNNLEVDFYSNLSSDLSEAILIRHERDWLGLLHELNLLILRVEHEMTEFRSCYFWYLTSFGWPRSKEVTNSESLFKAHTGNRGRLKKKRQLRNNIKTSALQWTNISRTTRAKMRTCIRYKNDWAVQQWINIAILGFSGYQPCSWMDRPV